MPKIESKISIGLINKSSIRFLNKFLLMRIIFQLTTSQRGKRIMIFEDLKIIEVRIKEKKPDKNLEMLKKTLQQAF